MNNRSDSSQKSPQIQCSIFHSWNFWNTTNSWSGILLELLQSKKKKTKSRFWKVYICEFFLQGTSDVENTFCFQGSSPWTNTARPHKEDFQKNRSDREILCDSVVLCKSETGQFSSSSWWKWHLGGRTSGDREWTYAHFLWKRSKAQRK